MYQSFLLYSLQRIIDFLPRIIDHDFLRQVGKAIRPAMTTHLGLDSDKARDKAELYLREDPAITEEREELRNKIRRLQEANEKLMNFA
jgi:hypothetical protein